MANRKNNPSETNSISSNDFLAQRKKKLTEFDNAKFSSLHIRACLVASAGFFTDGYSLHAISFVLLMLDYVYGDDNLTASARFMLKSSIRVGAVVGHLLFGYYADKYGRKKVIVMNS